MACSFRDTFVGTAVILLGYFATSFGVKGKNWVQEAKKTGVKISLPNLRATTPSPTSMPTVAPTPRPTSQPTKKPTAQPTTTKEDAKAVAAGAGASAGTTKANKPEVCSAEQIGKVQKSGMSGEECTGAPYLQKCSFTKLTRNHKATWLKSFAEEIREAHAASGDENSFFGVMVGGCNSLEKDLYFPTVDDAPGKQDVVKKAKLLCEKPGGTSADFSSKWGLDQSPIGLPGGKSDPLDAAIVTKNQEKAIKDFVHIQSEGITPMHGPVTTARARYVEFMYNWKGVWGGKALKAEIDFMDELGHTCYWAGDDKLWRITDCWQNFYSYKSWAFVACVNRNLAPKLAEAMEKKFLDTIS